MKQGAATAGSEVEPTDQSFLKNLREMNEDDIRHTADVIKSMAHPLRLKILCALGTDELSVRRLGNAVNASTKSNLSQHLSNLLVRNILANRKIGNQIFYRIRDPRILSLITLMRAVYC